MTPKKKKDITPDVALELGLEEDVVKEVVDFFWQDVVNSLREMRHLSIIIPELGEFCFVKSNIEPLIEKYNRFLGTLSPEDQDTISSVTLRIQRLEALLSLRDEEYKRRAEHRERRKKYEQNKKNLEK